MALPYLDRIAVSERSEFERLIRDTASRLSVRADDLMFVMMRESGLNPQARNPGSTASGLIQFMSTTAADLGTTIDAIRCMSASQQVEWVEKYYKMQIRSTGKQPRTALDLYLLTLYPIAVGQPDAYVLFYLGSKNHTANRAINTRGNITVGDVRRWVNAVIPKGYVYTPDTMTTSLWAGGLVGAALCVYLTKKYVLV